MCAACAKAKPNVVMTMATAAKPARSSQLRTTGYLGPLTSSSKPWGALKPSAARDSEALRPVATTVLMLGILCVA